MRRLEEIKARLMRATTRPPYEVKDRHQVVEQAWSDFYQHAPADIEHLLDLLEDSALYEVLTGLDEHLGYYIAQCEAVIKGEGYTRPKNTRAKAELDAYYTIKNLLDELMEDAR